ncbi:MAG: glycosyltransferase family 2 protein [Planctomycetes bacterium]|nr:glycosyltransferase family 2 protein [Planctomycetota bacterium]
MELSIVVPVYNEQDCVEKLYGEIVDATAGIDGCEVIFIDDGSTDNSLSILKELQGRDSRVRVIRFRGNFGQTAALSAGFDHARGKIIIPMDADLQNDPADIPRLLEKIDEGYDIVSGWRKKRHDTFLTRRLPSMIANKVISKITGVRLHDFGCTLKAYRSESVKAIKLYGEMHRFIPVLANWSGEKVAEMEVNHRARTTGKTKYGLNRTFKVVLDLITIKFLMSFSTKPIYVFGGLGALSGLGAFFTGFVVLYQKFISAGHLAMNRNPLLTLTAVLITTAIQFLLMGLLAEILVRTYHESQDRKIYMIEKIYESKEL